MNPTNNEDTGLGSEGPQHVSHSSAAKARRSVPKVSKKAAILVGLLVILIVTIAVSWAVWATHDSKTKNTDAAINKNEFQAVFLTNGQVYFGKLSQLGHPYVTLTDIFYLQVQQGDTSSQNLQQASGSTSNSKVSLAKLGSELHGPEDNMQVSSQQILFWENLKGNSKVVQAIDKYQGQ